MGRLEGSVQERAWGTLRASGGQKEEKEMSGQQKSSEKALRRDPEGGRGHTQGPSEPM